MAFPLCRKVRAPGEGARDESANRKWRTSICSFIRITPMSNSRKLTAWAIVLSRGGILRCERFEMRS